MPRLVVAHDTVSIEDRGFSPAEGPTALLRAETRERMRWAVPFLKDTDAKIVLDVGCIGGFTAGALASRGFQVTGLAPSPDALARANALDITGSVRFVQGNPARMPLDSGWFDAAFAFNVLQHVPDPRRVIDEIARVLKPGGLFFFQAFNATSLSWMLFRKGLEWFVRNAPRDAYGRFIRPQELERHCLDAHFEILGWEGLRPSLNRAFFRVLRTHEIPGDFQFTRAASLRLSYCGVARKK